MLLPTSAKGGFGKGDDLREQAIHLCGVGEPGATQQKTIQLESESLETLKHFVEQGQGMTLLPWLAVPREVLFDFLFLNFVESW